VHGASAHRVLQGLQVSSSVRSRKLLPCQGRLSHCFGSLCHARPVASCFLQELWGPQPLAHGGVKFNKLSGLLSVESSTASSPDNFTPP